MVKFFAALVVVVLMAGSAKAQSISGSFYSNPQGLGGGVAADGSYSVGAGNSLNFVLLMVNVNGTIQTARMNEGGNLWNGKNTSIPAGTWSCWARLSYRKPDGTTATLDSAAKDVIVP